MRDIRILLVEDDKALSDLLEYRLSKEGLSVRKTSDGEEALVLAKEELPDMVILDWMIEGISGVEVCRRLRKDSITANVPVIMLTARETEDDRIRGLENGADDYVTKPFSPKELIARIKTILRRTNPLLAGKTIAVGDLVLDPVRHKVSRIGKPLKIGPTELRLLQFFMENPSRVFSRTQVLDGVWGIDSDIEIRTVDVHIRRLRKAIAIDGLPDPIRTVHSIGYSIEAV